MPKKTNDIEFVFGLPKILADELDRLAKEQFISKGAVLRQLIARAAAENRAA